MNNKEIATEALGLAAVQYNFLHKYLDDKSYTKPAPFSSTSIKGLLAKLATDERFKGIFKEPGFDNIDPLFEKHESLVLEYWNAWKIEDPAKQFQESQEAAVALLIETVAPGTHSYNFFTCHLLTTSHAVRILLPFIPVKFHISLVRQWWLLTLAVYIAELRPKIDPDYVPGNLNQKNWAYVVDKAINSPYSTDAHYVKGKRIRTLHGRVLTDRWQPFAQSGKPREPGAMYMTGTWLLQSGLSMISKAGFMDDVLQRLRAFLNGQGVKPISKRGQIASCIWRNCEPPVSAPKEHVSVKSWNHFAVSVPIFPKPGPCRVQQ